MNKLTNGINSNKFIKEFIKQQDAKVHDKVLNDCFHERVHQMWGLNDNEGEDDESPFVDLGLPSGTLWAKVNLGASSETDYGNYYAWAETTGYKEATQEKQFIWEDYKFFDGYQSDTTIPNFTKYSQTDEMVSLEPEDDAATVILGNEYSVPTSDQAQELFTNCTYEFVTDYKGTGVSVAKFTSNNNGKELIIPAAGYYKNGILQGEEDYSYIWTSRARIGSYSIAYAVCTDYIDTVTYRCYGIPIRPVKNSN